MYSETGRFVWIGAAVALSWGGLFLGGAPHPAEAQGTFQSSRQQGMGRVDATPAATLLLPYFEVDLDDVGGQTTLLTVNNASSQSILTHLTVWTNLGIPVLDFHVFLTGYDAQAINLRDLLSFVLPSTAPDPEVSPRGAFSSDNPSLDVDSCEIFLPPPPLSPDLAAPVRAALTGNPSSLAGGQCLGVELGDNVARGYVTIDTVRECSLLLPGDPGYFLDGGQGVATNDNVLWGDVDWVNPTAGTAFSHPLVHLEAFGSIAGGFWNAGDHTFYSRVISSLADNREPLPAQWMAQGGSFEDTELLVWRDPGTGFGPFPCGVGFLDDQGLQQTAYIVFDEEENPDLVDALFGFPWVAQRITVVTPHSFGWTYVDLLDPTIGAQDLGGRQAHVTVLRKIGGSFLTGHPGIPLQDPLDLGDGLIFADGFESGDVTAWSGIVEGEPPPAPVVAPSERLASLLGGLVTRSSHADAPRRPRARATRGFPGDRGCPP